MVQFSKNFDLSQICEEISILVKLSKKFDFGPIQFLRKFLNISILLKFSKKNSIFLKILEKLYFFGNFEKFAFNQVLENFDFGQNLKKKHFYFLFSKNLHFLLKF